MYSVNRAILKEYVCELGLSPTLLAAKVSIYLLQEPPDGLKGLKKIKERLNLPQGYSELKSAAKQIIC